MSNLSWLDAVKWDDKGLVTAIAQDKHSQRIMMVANVNRESLQLTADTGIAHYWSRSRNRLWKKGEESGHLQKIVSLRTDCDFDVILLTVEQTGLACHTGRKSCFFNEWQGDKWQAILPIIKNPEEIYQA